MLKPSVLTVVATHSIPYSAYLFLMAGCLLMNFAVSIQTPPWDPPLPVRLAGHIVLSQPALGTCLRAVLSRSPCKWLHSSEFPASIWTGRSVRRCDCPRGTCPGAGVDAASRRHQRPAAGLAMHTAAMRKITHYMGPATLGHVGLLIGEFRLLLGPHGLVPVVHWGGVGLWIS
jgi:hypothetical protein